MKFEPLECHKMSALALVCFLGLQANYFTPKTKNSNEWSLVTARSLGNAKHSNGHSHKEPVRRLIKPKCSYELRELGGLGCV